jgi:hypothetical protein
MPRVLLAGLLALAATAAPAVATDDVPPPECPTELRTTDPCEKSEPPPTCARVAAAPGCAEKPREEELGKDADRPRLKGGFLSRVWRIDADVDAFDEGADVLNVTITGVANLPRRFFDQDDDLVDVDAYALFSATTRVYDAERRRVFRETRYDGLLDVADTVRIVGKVVPPRTWELDADGFPTPTLRAKRVYVTG